MSLVCGHTGNMGSMDHEKVGSVKERVDRVAFHVADCSMSSRQTSGTLPCIWSSLLDTITHSGGLEGAADGARLAHVTP